MDSGGPEVWVVGWADWKGAEVGARGGDLRFRPGGEDKAGMSGSGSVGIDIILAAAAAKMGCWPSPSPGEATGVGGGGKVMGVVLQLFFFR